MIFSDGIHVIGTTEKELHEWAAKHQIKRCWFHRSKIRHYDIPKRRRNETFGDVSYITPKQLVMEAKHVLHT